MQQMFGSAHEQDPSMPWQSLLTTSTAKYALEPLRCVWCLPTAWWAAC